MQVFAEKMSWTNSDLIKWYYVITVSLSILNLLITAFTHNSFDFLNCDFG